VALLNERTAHANEVLEAKEADNRILQALLDLLVLSAPPGTTLGEALVAGYVGVMEAVDVIRGAVTDPLVQSD
jgi:hypothetical protein